MPRRPRKSRVSLYVFGSAEVNVASTKRTTSLPIRIEFAVALAEKMRQHSSDPAEQISFAYLTVTQRKPDPEIIKEFVALYQDLKNDTSQSKNSLGPDPALTLTANTILNLDAALTNLGAS